MITFFQNSGLLLQILLEIIVMPCLPCSIFFKKVHLWGNFPRFSMKNYLILESKNVLFKIMLSHEINLTKCLEYLFERFGSKMISHYLMLNHHGIHTLKDMCYIILQNTFLAIE